MFKFRGDYGYQAFRILQTGFVIALIIAGFDKFFYFLTNWSQYLSPLALRVLGAHVREFMMLVGIIEMGAGIGVFFKPRFFSSIIALWLFLIILNLLLLGGYFDIILRDFVLLLAACALGKLSHRYSK